MQRARLQQSIAQTLRPLSRAPWVITGLAFGVTAFAQQPISDAHRAPAAAAATANVVQPGKGDRHDFDIPAQDMSAALQAIALASDHKLVFRSELARGLVSPALKGTYSTIEALDRVLSDTDLAYRITSGGVVLVQDKRAVSTADEQQGDTADASALQAPSFGEGADRPWRIRLAHSGQDAAAGVSDGSAVAPDNPGGLEEIVVTAQKRAQSLQEVPISVTAYSREQIEAYRLDGVQDYLELTPNVGFFTSGNTNNLVLSVRGVTNIGGYVNSLGVYVDEFNVTPGAASGTYEQELLDVERIEILRGPQGILFGRNLIGGAVSLTTRKPVNRLEAETTLEAGDYGTWLARGTVNLPVVSDRVALRATGYWRESDGYIKDIGPGGNRNDYEGKGGRVALRMTPNDALTFDLAASRNDYRQGVNDFLPSGVLQDVLRQLGFTDAIDDGQGFFPENRSRIATNRPTFSTNDTTTFTSRLEWDAGTFSIVSVSGYIDNEARYEGDGDMTATDFYVDDERDTMSSYSTGLRAQSNGDRAWDWLLGVAYSKDRTSASFLRVLLPPFMSLFGVDASRRIIDDSDRATAESHAVFGDLTWHGLDGRLTTSLGARFTRDRVFNLLFDNSDNLFTGIPLGNLSSGSDRFEDFSPRLSAVYQLTSDVNVYGTVSKGYKAGGFNFGAERIPGAPLNFDKEEAWNYEAGVKAMFFERRLQANLSLFSMKWQDIQVNKFFLDAGFNRVQFVENAAAASTRGFELALAAQPTEAWLFEMGVGYDDAVFDEYPEAIPTFGEPFDASGNQLPFAPEWSGSAAAQYGFHAFGDFKAFVRGEYAYRDELFTSAENLRGVGVFVPSYDTINVRVGIENERYSITAFAENALDDDYLIGERETEYLSGMALVVDPRRVGVRFTARFD